MPSERVATARLDSGRRNLDDAIAVNWSTPQVFDATDCQRSPKALARAKQSGGCANLREEVQNWPTPRAEDSESTGAHAGTPDTLTSATRQWPTPRASDWRSGMTSEETAQKNSRPLCEQAIRDAGPQCGDSLNIPGRRRGWYCLCLYSVWGRDFGRVIRRAYERRLKTGRGRRIGMVLNPEWVAQLQGVPDGWLDLDGESA